MNFNHMVIPLENVAWQQAGPNCRTKGVVRGRQRLRLVEFQKGFKEDGWCEKGHIGYVVDGRLDIEFPDQTVPPRIQMPPAETSSPPTTGERNRQNGGQYPEREKENTRQSPFAGKAGEEGNVSCQGSLLPSSSGSSRSQSA